MADCINEPEPCKKTRSPMLAIVEVMFFIHVGILFLGIAGKEFGYPQLSEKAIRFIAKEMICGVVYSPLVLSLMWFWKIIRYDIKKLTKVGERHELGGR